MSNEVTIWSIINSATFLQLAVLVSLSHWTRIVVSASANLKYQMFCNTSTKVSVLLD
jgi:hypothetical protein